MENSARNSQLKISGEILALLFLLAIGSWFYGFFLYLAPGTIAPGVMVGELRVGATEISSTMARLEPWLQELENTPIILAGPEGPNALVPKQDYGLTVSRSKLKEGLMRVGREGSLLHQWILRYKGHREVIKVEIPMAYHKEKGKKLIDSLNSKLAINPVEPVIYLKSDSSMGLVPGNNGRQVDAAAVKETISRLFLQVEDREDFLPLEEIPPLITEEEITSQGIRELVAYFTTSFDLTNTNRIHNIKVAAEALNNTLLRPGEVFSFNETVGPRSTEKDYKEAKVIVNNEFVDGTGGGVCQVSSALYNAALLGNLNIVERSNHSRPVSYLAAGRDATVVYDAVDLKFLNSRSTAIILTTEIRGNRLTTYIFGQNKRGEEVQLITREEAIIQPETKRKFDPSLPFGETVLEEGAPGLKVSLWRRVLQDNQLVREEKISQDIYKKVDNLIRVGQDSGGIR